MSRLHSINKSRALLGDVGRDTIYDLINLGHLEAKKIGRRTLVTGESLEKYIQNLPPFPRRSAETEAASILRHRRLRQHPVPPPSAVRKKSVVALGAAGSSLSRRKRSASVT
jgi:excisionase family DNA binding protein